MRTIALILTTCLALAYTSSADQIIAGKKLSLTLEAVPITSALSMIATQNGLNLVLSGEVEGDVTMRLQDVDVNTALDAILLANGYNYFLRDNIIVVKPVADDAAGELASRVVRLKYLDPITAQKALGSVKSAKGSITILDRSAEAGGGAIGGGVYNANKIVITDYPALLDDLLAVIEEIDVAERSLMIEAKIIETTIDSKSDLGIDWPTSLTATLSDAEGGTSGTETTDETSAGAGAVYDPSNGNWTWGKLSLGQVNWILNMLEQNGNSRLVSDPRITTLENHQAEFKFTTIIPIQTINRFTEGASTSDIVTFEDKEVGISLRVIARINEGNRITMEVEPIVEDILGYTGTAANQKPITASRSINAHVTVSDGETVALGGLLKETAIESINRVPILGRIPLLGSFLFSSKSTEKKSTDLLILITPHLID
jgi:type IV pilus assembly protein PilQ